MKNISLQQNTGTDSEHVLLGSSSPSPHFEQQGLDPIKLTQTIMSAKRIGKKYTGACYANGWQTDSLTSYEVPQFLINDKKMFHQ